MVVYPLSSGENRTIRWAKRIIPILALATLALLVASTITMASAQG